MFKNDLENGVMTVRGAIGPFEDGISADQFLDALQEHNGADVKIELDSPGGSVSDGMSIYNALMQYSGKVTVQIDTIAASIASVIACAADEAIMNSNAQFMIHNAWCVAMGNAKEFRGLIEQLDVLDAMICDVYVERTNAEFAELKEMMDNETFLTAKQALALGFVDSINEIKKSRKKDDKYALAMAPCVVSAKAKAMKMKLRASL